MNNGIWIGCKVVDTKFGGDWSTHNVEHWTFKCTLAYYCNLACVAVEP